LRKKEREKGRKGGNKEETEEGRVSEEASNY
jgi:hypothetical protein